MQAIQTKCPQTVQQLTPQLGQGKPARPDRSAWEQQTYPSRARVKHIGVSPQVLLPFHLGANSGLPDTVEHEHEAGRHQQGSWHFRMCE